MPAFFDDSLGTPPLAEAIDRQPLVVAPTDRVIDVVTLMYQTAEQSRKLRNARAQSESPWGARSSCVLVMQDAELQGIFTERDLVQLTASAVNLRATPISQVMHHPVLTISEQALHNIFAALFLFRRHRIRHLAITDQQRLVGVISLDSIRHILRPTNLLKIRRVAEVMSHQVVTAFPDTAVIELTQLMATQQISCVVILQRPDQMDSPSQRPIGIVTERDIVRFQAIGLDINRTQAKAVMSQPLLVLSPEDSLWAAHQAMEQQQVRRLVVSWSWGEKLGIVTQTSILRVFDPIEMHDVIETLQRTIQQLGLDLDQVLANAVDHDTQLSASRHAAEPAEIPSFKALCADLNFQIEHLLNAPALSIEAREAALRTMQAALQQFQHLLK